MGILKKIEKKLESAVEGFFAKGFKSKVEPVELGKKLALAMLNDKVVSLKKAWAPNEFEVRLSPDDNEQYQAYQKELVHELQDFLIQEAATENLKMMGRPKITFEQDEKLTKGKFEVKTKISDDFADEIGKTKDGATQLIPIEELQLKQSKHFIELQGSGLKYDLKEGKNTIGRSATSDIPISDAALSRKHIEIFLEDNEAVVKDLESTNGTMVNGKEIKSIVLKDNDEIQAGSSTFVYRSD